MDKRHIGSCLCERVKFEIEGDFESFFLCHCRYCQKDTGSAHAANLFSTTAKLKWLAGQGNVKSFALSGTRHMKSFCLECGSAVPNQQNKGQLLVVPAGCLNSDLVMKPNAHIFCSSRASWDNLLETIPKFEKFPS